MIISFDEIKEKNTVRFDRFCSKEAFLKNISNENFNVILREKINAKSISKREYLNELFNDNFLKENEKLLFNYLQEGKKKMKENTYDYSATKYSVKGFYKDKNDLKYSNTSYRLNDTLISKELNRFNESKLL